MRLQRPARPLPVMASILAAAGIALTVASCSHLAPLGPDSGKGPTSTTQPVAIGPIAMPVQSAHLRSPFVLEAMRSQPSAAAGGCPAGSVALSGGPGQCYRKLGTPVTVTSAKVSSIFRDRPPPPPGQQAGPTSYGFVIVVPAADQAALTAVTTTAANAHGYLSISIGDSTWLLPRVLQPFNGPQLMITRPSRNQALQIQRLLVPAA
jgi:hypothetical protein